MHTRYFWSSPKIAPFRKFIFKTFLTIRYSREILSVYNGADFSLAPPNSYRRRVMMADDTVLVLERYAELLADRTMTDRSPAGVASNPFWVHPHALLSPDLYIFER